MLRAQGPGGWWLIRHPDHAHLAGEFAARWGGKAGDCPVTEDVSDRLLRLPFFNSITDDQQEIVIQAMKAFAC